MNKRALIGRVGFKKTTVMNQNNAIKTSGLLSTKRGEKAGNSIDCFSFHKSFAEHLKDGIGIELLDYEIETNMVVNEMTSEKRKYTRVKVHEAKLADYQEEKGFDHKGLVIDKQVLENNINFVENVVEKQQKVLKDLELPDISKEVAMDMKNYLDNQNNIDFNISGLDKQEHEEVKSLAEGGKQSQHNHFRELFEQAQQTEDILDTNREYETEITIKNKD